MDPEWCPAVPFPLNLPMPYGLGARYRRPAQMGYSCRKGPGRLFVELFLRQLDLMRLKGWIYDSGDKTRLFMQKSTEM